MNPTVTEIQSAVAEHYGFTVDDLFNQDRRQPLAWVRQMAMFLAVELHPELRDQEVADLFRRDRKAVYHAVQTVKLKCEVYPGMRTALENILKNNSCVPANTQ